MIAAVTGPMPGTDCRRGAACSTRSPSVARLCRNSAVCSVIVRASRRASSRAIMMAVSWCVLVRQAAMVLIWVSVTGLRASVPRSTVRSSAVSALRQAVRC